MKLISSVQDSLVKHFPLLEKNEGLQILEELCSLNWKNLQKYSNLNIYSLKMLKDYLLMTEEEHLQQSSMNFGNWGMMLNGKCLTAKILMSLKIENECSLLGVLEERVPDKYFLSLAQQEKIFANSKRLPADYLKP